MMHGDPSNPDNGNQNGNFKRRDPNDKDNKNNGDNEPPKKGGLSRMFMTVAAVGLGAVLLSNVMNNGNQQSTQSNLDWTEFAEAADRGEFSNFVIERETGAVMGIYKSEGNTQTPDGEPAQQRVALTLAPNEDIAYQELDGDGAIKVQNPPEEGMSLFNIVFLSLIGVMVFMSIRSYMAQRGMMNGKGGGPFGVGKSNAKLMVKSEDSKTFDDVAGVEEAKEEVAELVEFLRDPEKFERLGAKMPTGALLVGPPGTGKTLLAKAVAGEAEVPFFSVSGSDFVQMFVGVGAARVRDMFEEAKKNAPCVIFIDEIDAIAKARGAGITSNDEREQTLNQLLVEMDGFEKNSGIIVLAATNRPDVLDPAIKRPGRLDRNVTVGLPDLRGRERILKIHTKNKPLDVDTNLLNVARSTPGFSGADLENLANEAAILATREDAPLITESHFIAARDKILMGPERKSSIIPDAVRENTAYHEAAHAIMLLHEEHADPLLKVTIMPRGNAGGMAMWMPDENKLRGTIAQMVAEMRVAMAGRIGEEILNGGYQVTGGAIADIQQATKIAKRMVTELGMSDALGKVRYAPDMEAGYLGGQQSGVTSSSPVTTTKVDKEIQKVIDDAFDYTMRVLTDDQNIEQLKKLAEALLAKETLEADEVMELLELHKLDDPLEKDYSEPRINKNKGPKPS